MNAEFVCRKCGNREENTFLYQDSSDSMRIACSRCGYWWETLPLDARRGEGGADSDVVLLTES